MSCPVRTRFESVLLIITISFQMNVDGKHHNQREAFQLLLKQHMVSLHSAFSIYFYYVQTLNVFNQGFQ